MAKRKGTVTPPLFSASSLLSSPASDFTTNIATGLKLSIDLHMDGDKQWLELKVEDDLNLTEAVVNYPILCTTLDRRYHLRESVVIAMRRLMQQAFDQAIISDSLGDSLSVWTPRLTPPEHMHTHLEEDDYSTPSSTDLASLLDSLLKDEQLNL